MITSPSILRRAVSLAVALAAMAPAPATSQAVRADPQRILADISTLADDMWEGRLTCTAGNDSAAAFIGRRFGSLGLTPLSRSTGAARRPADFFHRISVRPVMGNHAMGPPCETQNVAGILRGSDPVLAGEYVIVGAHFDHLGRELTSSTGVTAGDSLHNGADDNASGTAAVLELARLFRANPPRRSIVFVAFTGEEWGLLGSAQFADSALPAGRAQAMVNFDMVGRLRERLIVYGTGTAAEFPAVLESANAGIGLQIASVPEGQGPSDHTSFYAKDIPVLHFFTDTHREYHSPADEAHLINGPGTARVVDFAAAVIRSLADRREQLAFVETAAPVRVGASSGTRPYLGSVPDMAGSGTPGLRITDITAGSPADKGGMLPGDIVVELDGKPVTDLNTYAEALYARSPGDTIRIVVTRNGARVTLTVTLTARGG